MSNLFHVIILLLIRRNTIKNTSIQGINPIPFKPNCTSCHILVYSIPTPCMFVIFAVNTKVIIVLWWQWHIEQCGSALLYSKHHIYPFYFNIIWGFIHHIIFKKIAQMCSTIKNYNESINIFMWIHIHKYLL